MITFNLGKNAQMANRNQQPSIIITAAEQNADSANALSGNIDASSGSSVAETSVASKAAVSTKISAGGRLQSLDFYRGLVMTLLMLESSGITKYLINISAGTKWHPAMLFLFEHATWHALHFWDLIQPGFMFIAGAAMAFSIVKQTSRGIPLKQQWSHALRRSGWLFFWGVLDYAVSRDHLVFELWDVLTQLSFTLLVAFAIFRWKVSYQIAFSFGLLLLTQVLYKYVHIPGFDQPFTDQHNFGNYIDMLLMNKTSPGGWVAINCLPTAAHTIWGAVVAKLLLMSKNENNWMKTTMAGAIALLVLGYAIDITGVAPIVKRIATISFTLVSGGWCILALVALYWWIDIKKHTKGIWMLVIVGMNSIFIYLFMEIVVGDWLSGYTQVLVGGFFRLFAMPDYICTLIACISLFIFEWQLCRWLYHKKIFFKV